MPPLPVIVEEEEEEYEVEELMDSQFKRNKLEYLVQWKVYPNPWEPEEKIIQDNKDEFHENHPAVPRRVDTHQIKFRKKVVNNVVMAVSWTPDKKDCKESDTNVYLPLRPEHFPEMEKGNKMSEYRNQLMEGVKRFWFWNTKTHFVTHMAEVNGRMLHNAK